MAPRPPVPTPMGVGTQMEFRLGWTARARQLSISEHLLSAVISSTTHRG